MKKAVIVIPCYNEEEILESNIKKLHSYCSKNLKKFKWEIMISDNNSEDSTLKIAKKLSAKLSHVSYYHMDDKPRSKAIKKIWLEKDADIYSYMDADLSTDISHLKELLDSVSKGYDIVIGSRTQPKRTFFRKIMSKSLILLIKTIYSIEIKDFQCGFKAISRKVRDTILAKMKSVDVGFMDTELILVASQKTFKIKEIPVRWEDLRTSKSPIVKGVFDALFNLFRIKYRLIRNYY